MKLKLKIAYILFFAMFFYTSIFNAQAQEGAYWQGLAVKNPAAIGTPSDWIFGGYLFTNVKKLTEGSELGPTAFVVGADYKITPKIGSVGVNFVTQKIGLEKLDLIDICYAYSIPFKNGFLNAGLSVGLNKYEDDLSNYYSYDPLFNHETKMQHLKTGIGLFYNTNKIDLGISTVRYFELKDEDENGQYYNYEIDYTSNSITLLGAYRFNFINKLVIEPNLMVDFYKKSSNINTGIFLNYNEFFWAGYTNLNFDDLHSLFIGFDIAKRFRAGYSYNFTKLFSSKDLNLHEIILGIKLN